MIKVKVISSTNTKTVESDSGLSLLNILRKNGYNIYAPCGGKGTCGKCRVKITGEGEVISCKFYPDKDIEVILPREDEANILVHQTEYLEDMPFRISNSGYLSYIPYGVAIDIGTNGEMALVTGEKILACATAADPAFEGPVLDIKPYLPSVDGVKSIKNELIEKELGLPGSVNK